MTNVLAEICEVKRAHVAERKAAMPERLLAQVLQHGDAPRGFRRALEAKRKAGQVGLIAEVKKASPSKGVIRADFDPVALAQAYEQGGAACLSVLTDIPYFQGHDNYLMAARQAVALPVLRKDFMLDPYQVLEARALGADCILLIVAALSPAQAAELEAAAFELGMDVLVEVHDEAELDVALSHLKSTLIGINNRSLKTLKVDLATTRRLAGRVPQSALCVCESGVSGHADVQTIRGYGVSTFLVGESLMREDDVQQATRSLLGFT
jgi:indole-3-glycerol phosphate synthase